MDYHIAAHSVYYCNRLVYELVRMVRQTARGTITRQVVEEVEREQTCKVQFEGHPLTRHMCDWHDCYIVWSKPGPANPSLCTCGTDYLEKCPVHD